MLPEMFSVLVFSAFGKIRITEKINVTTVKTVEYNNKKIAETTENYEA